MDSFPDLEPVRCCSMSSSNCCFLTCIQISQEAGQVVWYSHLLKNSPQFVVIHTVKGFGVFLELSCFFDDPSDVGNLIPDSSASLKPYECTFELCCWRRLLRVPWTARRSNQSILKEINPEYSLEGLILKLKLQYFGHLMQRTDSLGKTLLLRKIEGRRRMG